MGADPGKPARTRERLATAAPTLEERLLVYLLRFCGGTMLLAFPAVLLPVDWMAATHAWLGLGDLPRAPLVDYLARSIAMLYGIHGGLWLMVAADLRRHARIAVYLAVMNVVFGLAVIAIDVHAGLPAYWTWVEGPPIIAAGSCALALLRAAFGRSR